MGGETNLTKLKAITWKSKGTFQFKSDPSPFTSQWAMQGPDQYRKTRDEAENGQPHSTTLVLNADKGWFRDHNKKLITFPAGGLSGLRQENFLHWMALRLDLTDKALTLSPLGGSRVEGREVLGIRVTHGELHDVEFELYFDNETGLLTKMVTKKNTPEERIFSNYREIGGILYATKLKWTARYGEDLAVQEEERFDMKLYEKLDGSIFDQP